MIKHRFRRSQTNSLLFHEMNRGLTGYSRPVDPRGQYKYGYLMFFLLVKLSKCNIPTQTIQLHITAPLFALGFLMFNNPFYSQCPTSLPLMFVTELVIIRMYFMRHKAFLHKIDQINLLDDGHTVEFVYWHVFPRKIRNLPISKSYYAPDLVPVAKEEVEPPVFYQYPQWPKRGWTRKCFINRQNYFNLPVKNERNDQLLGQIFQGISIDVS